MATRNTKTVILNVTASTKQRDDILGFVQAQVPFEIPDNMDFQTWITENIDVVSDALGAMQAAVEIGYIKSEKVTEQYRQANISSEGMI